MDEQKPSKEEIIDFLVKEIIWGDYIPNKIEISIREQKGELEDPLDPGVVKRMEIHSFSGDYKKGGDNQHAIGGGKKYKEYADYIWELMETDPDVMRLVELADAVGENFNRQLAECETADQAKKLHKFCTDFFNEKEGNEMSVLEKMVEAKLKKEPNEGSTVGEDSERQNRL